MKDCIELILANASMNPQNPCVIDASQQISYNQFITEVQSVATYLKSNNCSKVLLNMNQGKDAYVAIVATLLVGGYYCPLNLESPEDRKIYVINEFDPDIIITQSNLVIAQDKIDKYKQVTVPETSGINVLHSPLSELLNKDPNEIAYVIYTSGSTGNPKGVVIRRRALNKFLEWSLQAFKCTSKDRWAQYSSLSFDLSIVDIFTTFCSGAALVPLSEMGQKLRPANTIAKQQVTIWHSVPGAVDYMIQNEKGKPADLSSVRLMSFCGEPLYEYHLEYLFSKNPTLTIFNTYGPTEGTLFCTWIQVTATNYKEFTHTNISIGSPIPGWDLLLEKFEDDVKQVIIYGDYLGKGYLNSDSKAFGPKKINNRIELCYDTGDLVKEIDSNLYFIGRKDNQIKLRGYRIELDEIDSWIMKFTGVKSVSIIHSDAIHSFIEDQAIDHEGLKAFLESNIERYKVPAYFHTTNSLPRNSNQKVDRLALKKIIDEKGKTNVTV